MTKLILIVLTTTLLQLSNAATYSQTVTLKLKKEKLETVLDEIGRQTGFDLIYSTPDIRESQLVSINLKNASLNEALQLCFNNQALIYTISDKTIIVQRKPFKTNEVVPAEETLVVIISGQVTDETGSLPGVSVRVKGTTIGTVTDLDGKYTISVPENNNTLVFSSIGYKTREVLIEGRTDISVVLEVANNALTEVVVTALGIERDKKSLTYSTQNVSTDELSESRELNVLNSLQGKVAGLSINTNSTGVGAGTRVVLRGNRSISGDSQPLYVIDGIPLKGQPDFISPDNIASMNVLKGPSAAALYGSDAQNGAIIIETIKGKKGVARVSLNNNFQVGVPDIIPQQNIYGQGFGGVYNKNSEASWGPKMDGQLVDHWSTEPNQPIKQYALTPQPNNVRDLIENSYNMSSNLLADISSERVQTVFSYTFNKASGIIPSNDLKRNNVSVRIGSQLTDRLSLDSKLDYMLQSIDNPLRTGDDANFNPYRIMYTMPRNIQTHHVSDYEYYDDNGIPRQNFWSLGSTESRNPYWMMHRNLTEQKQNRILAFVSLKYRFTDALSLMIRGAYDQEDTKSENSIYNDTFVHYTNGFYSVNKSDAGGWNSDLLLSYNKNISNDWGLVANIGGNIQTNENTSLTANTNATAGLIIPNFFNLANTTVREYNFNPGAPKETQSLYAFGQLAWKSAIFLDVTGRNDWSSTLPSESRSYFYPSVGISAILSDLVPSLPKTISFIKLRGSFAKVGSSAPAQSLIRTASFFPGGFKGYLRLNNILPNPNLVPEETISYEAGFDIRFFNGRLGLDITGYKTNTKNQLFKIALPSGSGASEYFTNGGDIENKGLEVLLVTKPVVTKNFNWNFDLNFATNRNWVNRISDERPRVIIRSHSNTHDIVVEQGKEFGDMYSTGWLRDDQDRVLVADNGMPRIATGRVIKIANFNPDWMGGISNSISYKNFSASFLIDHRQGGSFISHTSAVLHGQGNAIETLEGRDGGLIFGENLFGNETAVLANGQPNNIPINAETFWRKVGTRLIGSGEAFVEDATNTRLREVIIGYSLPKSLVAKWGSVTNVRLSLVGRNVLFLHNASKWDPDFLVSEDTSAPGLHSFSPPTTRTFGFNVKIDF